MAKDKRDVLVIGLVAVILVLVGIVSYIFLINPAINAQVVKGYNQGVQNAILSIAQQAVTCQQVPLPVGNQTLNLIAVDCLKQVAAQTASQQAQTSSNSSK